MALFHVIDDGFAILQSRGIYRQAKVYAKGERLYAGWGSGFVGLSASGGTTAPNVSWQEIELPGVELITRETKVDKDTLGRLHAPANHKQLEYKG